MDILEQIIMENVKTILAGEVVTSFDIEEEIFRAIIDSEESEDALLKVDQERLLESIRDDIEREGLLEEEE